MRSGSGDQGLIARTEMDGTTKQSHKCSKISYSRDFLLSLGRMETCKNLPRDFDPPMLREFEDTSTHLLVSPPNSDFGCCINLSRGLIRNPAHDGLLGSGRFMAIASTPKVQGHNDFNILIRSGKPYHLPHSNKFMPLSGKGSSDSYNEETFGSYNILSEERAKKERRKESCSELMKKDQHKALGIQEKNKKVSDESKSEDFALSLPSNSGSAKGFLSTPTLSSRQPTPAFISRSIKKNFGTKMLTNSSLKEAVHGECNDNQAASADGNPAAHMACDSKEIQPEKFVGSDFQQHETLNGNSKELYHCCKPNVLQDVYGCTNLGESPLSVVKKKHPNQCEHVQGWSVSNIDDGQCELAHDHGETSRLFTWIHGGTGKNDPELSSDMIEGSSAKLLKFGSDSKSHNISGNGNTSRFESNLTHELILGTGFTEEMQLSELLVIQKDSVGGVTRDNAMEPWMHPILDGHDNIVLSVVDECRANGDKYEVLMSSSHDKEVGLNKTKDHHSGSGDIQPEKGSKFQIEQQPTIIPDSGFDEKAGFIDEICLPDEDSLFTFDYSTVPQDSIIMSDDNSFEADLFASSTQVDLAKKLAALNFPCRDEKSDRLGFGTNTPFHNSHDAMGMETYNPHAQLSYPQFAPAQVNPQIRTYFCFQDSRPYPYNQQSHQHSPINVFPTPCQQPHTMSARPDYPVNHRQFERMAIPDGFSHPQLLSGQQRGLPSNHINQLPCYAQKPNTLQAFPASYQQLSYGGHGISNPDPSFGRYHNQGAFNQIYQNESMARQMEPFTLPDQDHASRITWDLSRDITSLW